jgi:hypothetical protein
MTLDINVLIEQAARAIVANIDSRPGAWDALSPQAREYWLGESTTALAVIVPAFTAEVRALHHRHSTAFMAYDCECGDCDHEGDCPITPTSVCIPCSAPEMDHYVHFPCPTVRLLDELDGAARGERS